MKKFLSTFLLEALVAIVFAQAPQLLNYQAVVRNAQGQPVENTAVNFQFQIHSGTQGGSVVFTEADTATTNQFGLATVKIGNSTPLTGVSWGSGAQYLQVGVDVTGGTSFVDMGTSQLLSAPYALYAATTNAWGLTGDTGTTYGTNFIGTVDNQDLMIRVNDSIAGRIESDNYNASFGYLALDMNTARYNSAFGNSALTYNTTGESNTAVGWQALDGNQTGNYNTACGISALSVNGSGNNNSAFGFGAMYLAIQTNNNSAFGAYALTNIAYGANNVAVGFAALYNSGVISEQVAVGDSALFQNIAGGGGNTALGSRALLADSSGSDNTAVGTQALYANTTGADNTAVGHKALITNTVGKYNTALGLEALYSNIDGSNNTALGDQALFADTASNNIAVGSLALSNNTSGTDNTAVGNGALGTNATGSDNTALGYEADVSVNNLTNATAIGYKAKVGASNTIVLGNSSVTALQCNVQSITALSDGRVKDNVQENVPGLEFIKRLRPVTYNLNIHRQYELLHNGEQDNNLWDGKYDIEKITQSGFIAQEVEQAANAVGYDFNGLHKPSGPAGLYGLGYSDFVVPLVKAVQEQQHMIDELKAQLLQKETENNQLAGKQKDMQGQLATVTGQVQAIQMLLRKNGITGTASTVVAADK